MRRGQSWSFDYTVAFVLFTITLLFAISILVRTNLTDDTFDDLWRESEQLSQRLMGSGYPSSWRAGDVVAIGLLTDDLLSRRKVERFAEMIAEDYEGTKAHLDLIADYAITFEELNGTLLGMGAWCRLGLGTETKSLDNRTIPLAYYYRSGEDRLRSKLSALDADLYADDELGSLLESIGEYWMVVMEEPDLTSITRPYDGEKGSAIEEYVRLGGTLLLVGNVNLTEAFFLNLTRINTSANASGLPTNDTFLPFENLTLEGMAGFALQPDGEARYEALAELPDGREVAASFTHGDGEVYYLGGLDGSLNETGQTIESYIEDRLERHAERNVSVCTSVEPPLANAEHVVHITRLVGYEGRIIRMNIDTWVGS